MYKNIYTINTLFSSETSRVMQEGSRDKSNMDKSNMDKSNMD